MINKKSSFNLDKSVNTPVFFNEEKQVSLVVKREDQIHPYVSGNKYRKLKYNINAAKLKGNSKILTFGGAFSNHIAATAAIGQMYNVNTIGVIRGEELEAKINKNPTLLFAKQCGMQFEFVSRSLFREKNTAAFISDLRMKYGDFYSVPEGGTNDLAIKGCEEILTEEDKIFDFVCVPVGTGGTISGIINSSKPNQNILGFSALKGDFLTEDISKFAKQDNWKLITDYHFGGYAKINEDLVTFINTFKAQNKIPLDPIYTGKMMFGILDLIKQDYFPKHSRILAIHTGGLQGIEGMNWRLSKKGLPLIK